MTDRFVNFMTAESTFARDDVRQDYIHHLASLREHVVSGGRLIELEYPHPHFDFPAWLMENQILHHFEWVPFMTSRHSECAYIVHVYAENDAFLIRMETGKKPMAKGWRDVWAEHGFEACRKSLFPPPN